MNKFLWKSKYPIRPCCSVTRSTHRLPNTHLRENICVLQSCIWYDWKPGDWRIGRGVKERCGKEAKWWEKNCAKIVFTCDNILHSRLRKTTCRRLPDSPPLKSDAIEFLVPIDAQCSETYAKIIFRFLIFFVKQNFHFKFLVRNILTKNPVLLQFLSNSDLRTF